MKISRGNSKVPFANISLTPIKSCKGCVDICGKDCYALKSYKQYPNVRNAWDGNLEQATTDIDSYFTEIRKFLKTYKKPLFRWHVAGDIINMTYFDYMIQIAYEFPAIKFLVFTKQYAIVNTVTSYLQGILPENLSIVFSSWTGLPMHNPHGFPIAWYQDGTETRIPDTAIPCFGSCETCNICWSLKNIGRDVVFEKH